MEAAVEQVRQHPHLQLQIKMGSPDLDGLVDGIVSTPWRESYVLRLPGAKGKPFRIADSHNRATIKWAVSKAKRLGVQVRPAQSESDLREWYALYLGTMRRHVIPTRPYRFFAALWELLQPQGMMQLLLAEKPDGERNKIIAGSIFLVLGRTVSYAFNGSSSQDFSLRPNDVIQWQAINDACEKGFELFDFGEVSEGNVALAKFKSKWGAEPTRLYRYYHPSSGAVKDGVADASSYASRLGGAIWQHLPLKTTAWLSDRIFYYL